MRLVDVQPAVRSAAERGAQDRVRLNEDLVFTFSEEVDFSTVTGRSFRLVDPQGAPVAGTWKVERKQVLFDPRPVLSPELDDGGFLPDTVYRVEIAGFPRVDGVRGIGGAFLERSYQWSFRTVARDAERLFEDASPFEARLLVPPTTAPAGVLEIGPTDALELWCFEPLDPTSIRDGAFELRRRGDARPIAVRARLVANRDEWVVAVGQPCAVLELVPRQVLPPGSYLLQRGPDFRIVDLGGNAVRLPPTRYDGFRVVVHEALAERRLAELELDFLTPAGATPEAVPGADGTARWDGEGRVDVRFPAAAGDGRAGPVALEDGPGPADLHATRLFQAEGVRTSLPPAAGLVVLRAQGRLHLAGELVRESGLQAPPMELYQREDGAQGPLEPLSAWLEAAQAANPTWTVLVAGGDLVIDGTLEVDTPLLLAAGGRIRVPDGGRVRARAGELWLLGAGGGFNLEPKESRPNRVFLDEPLLNPLRDPLRWAVLSAPLPIGSEVERWLSAEAAGQHRGGHWRVRYLTPGPDLDPAAAVDDPGLLPRIGPVRVLIELEVRPGGLWRPPFVDRVHLAWEELPG